ncbi:MAG: argininosuccinate lyase, partial [Bacteroidetes bacterium OLB12]
MKLWSKDKESLKTVTDFTTGQDNVLDLHLAPFDVLGSLAHITMLETIGLLTKPELDTLRIALKEIY